MPLWVDLASGTAYTLSPLPEREEHGDATIAPSHGPGIFRCRGNDLRAGLPCDGLASPGRKLVIESGDFRYILAKPSDVPLYVSYGTADLAFAGGDVLLESAMPVVELLDTGSGRCFRGGGRTRSQAERFRDTPLNSWD